MRNDAVGGRRPALRRKTALGAPCGLAAVLVACAPALNWRDVHPQDADGLVALFPCKPDHQAREVPWPGVAQPVSMHLLSCKAGGRAWALSYARMPEVGAVLPALRVWPSMLRGNLAATVGAGDRASAAQAVQDRDLGPVQVAHMTPSEGARAWGFSVRAPDAAAPQGDGSPVRWTAWHFSHGLTVFQASVSQPQPAEPSQSSEDVAEAFFHGLHFPG